MKLALVAPLPPLATAEAPFMAALARLLAERVEVALLARDPAHVAAELCGAFPVHACADLPHLVQSGAVDLPVYAAGNSAHCAHQVRFVREVPGLLLLEDGDLARLHAELVLEPAAEPLCRRLARCSRGVLATAEAAAALGEWREEPAIGLLPQRDAALWAEAILRAAAALGPAGRTPAAPQAFGRPSVEVVIVSYNCRDILEPCLRSVREQDYPNVRCTVVDNASRDGTADYVRAAFPEVNLIASTENLGFAGGNNMAFERSTADYVALLNQDAVARRDWLTELVRVAERDASIAMVGSKMMMLRCPTIFNSTGISMNRIGFPVDRQIGEKDEDPSPLPEEIFGACGGALLVRGAVLRELGGFDEAFFMYFEDMHLSWRIWLSGRKIVYAPLAVVHHDWHGDLGGGGERRSEAEFNAKTARRRVHCERNRLQTMLKNYSLRSLLAVLPDAWRYDRVRLASIRAALLRGDAPEYFRMVEQAIRGAWRWNLLHLPSIWRRRRAAQRLRRVGDLELTRLISAWPGEPSFIGDLDAINDRHSARPESRVVMGETDGRSLGPGWHGIEPRPDLGCTVRWTKARAWVYLKAEQPAAALRLQAAAGPRPVDLVVSLETGPVGSARLEAGGMSEIVLALPRALPSGRTHEVRLDCSTFRPCDLGMGPDSRELGVLVAEVALA
ncbi:MAG: glycosyltransferase family 2 protein [Planctomycetes bacterium]|nr:glycosyltransferase family 2 protein [Planctomycetota bacterium]